MLWHKAQISIITALIKKLLVDEAAKEAEKTGASGDLIKAIAGKVGKEEAPKGETPEIPETDITAIPTNAQGFAAPLSQQQVQSQFLANRQSQLPIQQPVATLPPPSVLPQQAQVPQVAQAQARAPGIFAGLKEGVLNLPSEGFEKIPAGRTGRQAAFATGETIGDFLRANLLQLPTADPTAPKPPTPSRQITQKRLDLLNQLESGERKIATLKPFERIILRPPTTSTIDILEGELERDRELGLEKPDSVTDEEWFSANDETKRALMGL